MSEIHRCGRTRSHFRPRQLPESDGSVSDLVGSRELVSAKAVGFLQGTQNAAATADGRGSLHSRRLVSDVQLEKCSGGRQAGHSDRLASQGLQALLAMEVAAGSTAASS